MGPGEVVEMGTQEQAEAVQTIIEQQQQQDEQQQETIQVKISH